MDRRLTHLGTQNLKHPHCGQAKIDTFSSCVPLLNLHVVC